MARRRKRKGFDIHGILLLDKPLGISSNRALQRACGIFKANKAGHTGSLDPLATGVLPICFGEATKVSSYLLDSDKRYITTAQLGITTETGDREGNVIATAKVPQLSHALIESILTQFRGKIEQTPPMHSALKHKGKPLYELARQGIVIERQTRTITIHQLKLIDFSNDSITLDIQCSKGTYIRTLLENIGQALNCGAHLTALKRTEVSPFQGNATYTLDELEKRQEQNTLNTTLLPVDDALKKWDKVHLDHPMTNHFCQGRKQIIDSIPLVEGKYYRVYGDKKQFLGIAEVQTEQRLLAPKRLFHIN